MALYEEVFQSKGAVFTIRNAGPQDAQAMLDYICLLYTSQTGKKIEWESRLRETWAAFFAAAGFFAGKFSCKALFSRRFTI